MKKQDLMISLYEAINAWAQSHSLCATIIGSEMYDGILANISVLPVSAFADLYRQHANGLGLLPDHLGGEIELPSAGKFTVVGLDPISTGPLILLQSQISGKYSHMRVDEFQSLIKEDQNPTAGSEVSTDFLPS